jgi:hypothetical protein
MQMKSWPLCLFLLVMCPLTLLGQSNGDYRRWVGLIGNVRKTVTRTRSPLDTLLDSRRVRQSIVEYSSAGLITRIETFSRHPQDTTLKVLRRQRFFYLNGLVDTEEIDDGEGKMWIQRVIERNSDGFPLLSECVEREEKVMTSYLKHKMEFVHYEKNVIRLKTIVERNDEDIPVQEIIQVFRKQGELLKTITRQFEYKVFDEIGNWKTRIVHETGTENEITIEERQIIYY